MYALIVAPKKGGRGDVMSTLFGFLLRLIVGGASVAISILVLDAIHDRNTEIVVACLGLTYCFTFVISRRWQYYGLNAVSLFGVTVSWVTSEPFDQSTRDQLNMPRSRSYAVLSIFFAALVELVCAYRLLTTLLGHGWDRLAAPLRPLLDNADLQFWLSRL